MWSPAGKGLTSWLSFVVYKCEFVTFPLVFWVRCGTWLYQFLIFAPLLTLGDLLPRLFQLSRSMDMMALTCDVSWFTCIGEMKSAIFWNLCFNIHVYWQPFFWLSRIMWIYIFYKCRHGNLNISTLIFESKFIFSTVRDICFTSSTTRIRCTVSLVGLWLSHFLPYSLVLVVGIAVQVQSQ